MRVPPSQSNDRLGGPGHGVVGPTAVEGLRDAGEAGAEAEHLHAGVGPAGRVGELEQVAGVVRHRAGHVEDQDQGAGAQAAPAPEQLGGLAVGALGLPHGAPQVRPRAGAALRGPAAASPRRGEPELGHDPSHGGQLLGRAGGEGLVAQHLGVGGDQPERRLLVVAAGGRRLVGGDVQRGGDIRPRPDGDPERLGVVGALVEEPPPEHPVVRGDLVAPGDQRGAAGPVEVDHVGGVERLHGRAVGEDVAGPGADAGGPQLAGEVDQHPDEGGVGDGRLRHRTRRPPGGRAPGRGRPAP